MYDEHFGFLDPPFNITPDPCFFYRNPTHQQAFATLRYAIEARKGVAVITGEAGTGKSTLLKAYMEGAESFIHTVLVYNPKLSATELLEFSLNDLGTATSGDDRPMLIRQLHAYLIDQLRKGDIVALLVDEAQDLNDDLFEELTSLSELESDGDKLLQIVLVGQPGLEKRLEQPELHRLKQRVALWWCVGPLKNHEIQRYIDFRLKTAGYEGTELFDAASMERIGLYSRGIPRLVNVICDNALFLAFSACQKRVSAELVEEAALVLRLAAPSLPEGAEPARELQITEGEDNAIVEELPEPALRATEEPAESYENQNRSGLGVGMLLGLAILGCAVFYDRILDLVAGRFVNSHSARVENAGSAVVGPEEQGSIAPEARRYPPQDKPDEISLPNSKQRHIFPGVYEVVSDSPLFDKPQKTAAMVITLPPRTWIQVENRSGNYLRVRSLNDPGVRGYLYLQDASLERISRPKEIAKSN